MAEQLRSSLVAQTADEFAASNRKALVAMITDPKNVDFVDASAKNQIPRLSARHYELMTTDLRPYVKAIRTPVLLIGATATIADDQRPAIETVYRQQVSTIPNHKVVFAPKAKHFIQLDEPQYFYAQVESFLKASDAPGAK